MRLPTWIAAPVRLIAAAVRHPNTAQVMTIQPTWDEWDEFWSYGINWDTERLDEAAAADRRRAREASGGTKAPPLPEKDEE